MSRDPGDVFRPAVRDLAPWAKRALDEAYKNREREKASRDDFSDGFIAALLALHSRSAFLSGRVD